VLAQHKGLRHATYYQGAWSHLPQKTNSEFIRYEGWVYLEKRGRWTKRFMEIKLSGIYHYKDTRVRGDVEASACGRKNSH